MKNPFNFSSFKPATPDKPRPVISDVRFSEIQDSVDLRNLLESEELDCNYLGEEDYKAIITRAGILIEASPEMDEQEAIVSAYFDRIQVTGLAAEIMKKMDRGAIINALGEDISPEDLELFIKHMEAGSKPNSSMSTFEAWKAARNSTKASVGNNIAVVGKDDSVISVTDRGRAEALKKAAEDNS